MVALGSELRVPTSPTTSFDLTPFLEGLRAQLTRDLMEQLVPVITADLMRRLNPTTNVSVAAPAVNVAAPSVDVRAPQVLVEPTIEVTVPGLEMLGTQMGRVYDQLVKVEALLAKPVTTVVTRNVGGDITQTVQTRNP